MCERERERVRELVFLDCARERKILREKTRKRETERELESSFFWEQVFHLD